MTNDEILGLLIQIYHIGHRDECINHLNSFKAVNEAFDAVRIEKSLTYSHNFSCQEQFIVFMKELFY